MRLTGKKRFRVDKEGRLILQVQYSYLGMGVYIVQQNMFGEMQKLKISQKIWKLI